MDKTTTRSRLVVGAAVLLCLVVAVPIALAGDSGGPHATASAKLKKKVKKLSKRVKKLEREQGQPRPPSGQAGGDLAGEYPNPAIALGSLGTGEFSNSIPAARVTRTAAQSIPSGTATVINFNAERYDTAAMHNNATNNSRLRAPVTGIYAVTAQVEWEVDMTGNVHRVSVLRNGTTPIADANAVPGDTPLVQQATTEARLQAGDFVQAVVEQASGGDLAVTKDPESTPEFAMTWLAPGP
jgi:hypothetical protein